MTGDGLRLIVKEELDRFDAYGLLAAGAPADEFESETVLICARLRRDTEAPEIARIMADVFNRQFEPIFRPAQFRASAERIRAALSGKMLPPRR